MARASKISASLRIGESFALPLGAVTETFAILGQRGTGKTSTSVVLAEEMLAHRQRVAIIDPLGVWWGLRSSADGKGEGFPVVIFGGDHADLPIEPSAGELIANLVASEHIACIIDLSHMRKAEQRTFMTAFAETLYHRNRDALHLVVDEADLYAGQRPPKGAERLLGAMEDLVRRGRSRGIGLTLISQRPAVIHKDVLSQTSVLVAMRLVSPQDVKALDAWISQHDIKNVRGEFLDSLPSLPVGTAWVWSPGAYEVFQKVPVRRRTTYDSSATPKVGEKRTTPARYATVDLEALSAQMSDLVERKRESDPNALQRRVASLTADLKRERAKEKTATETVTVEVPVEVPVLPPEQVQELGAIAESMREQGEALLAQAGQIVAALSAAGTRRDPAPAARQRTASAPATRKRETSRPAPVKARTSVDAASDQPTYDSLRAGAKRIMESLARFYPDPLSKPQIGTLATMKFKSGTFSTYLGELKRFGFVDDAPGGLLVATDLGAAVVGDIAPRPTTHAELYDLWTGRLRAGAVKMLDVVLEADPASVNKQEIADGADLSASSGTFSTYLGELKRFGLVTQSGQEYVLGDVWDML